MLLEEVAATSTDVAATSSRLKKVERISSVLAELRPDEVPIAVAYLSGVLPHGSIGVGWASLREVPPPAREATLELTRSTRRSAGSEGSPAPDRKPLARTRSTTCSPARPSRNSDSCGRS